jgi:putative two-component system response regulator
MIQMAHDIAISHHEKWRGDGYPKGLAGETIPEVGRIVALVDVYDALSQDRVYRKAEPEAEVLRQMQEGRGSHFDPLFYDLFLESVKEFRNIARAHP